MRNEHPIIEKFNKNGYSLWDEFDVDQALVFLDFLVSWNANEWANDDNAELERILHDAGPEWRVGERSPCGNRANFIDDLSSRSNVHDLSAVRPATIQQA